MTTPTTPDASAAFRPDQILVRFETGTPAADQSRALEAIGGRLEQLLLDDDGDGELHSVALGQGMTVEKAMEILSHLPGVKFAEPDYELTTDAVSNDSLVTAGSTWGLYGDTGTPTNVYGSQATEAWAAGYVGTTKTAVGVIDTGVDYTHPDLYLNIWLNQREIPTSLKSVLKDTDSDGLITFRDLNNGANASYVADKNANGRIDAGDLLNDVRWENGVDEDANGHKDDLIGWDWKDNDNDPMDTAGHGTHVAGTIGATGGNGVGVAGVNWNTQIVALRFMDATGGATSGAVQAVEYFTKAAQAGTGVDFAATNNSWGGGSYSQGLLDAIVRGAKQQILFVAAAGNGGSDGVGDNIDSAAYYPASYSTVSGAGYEAVVAVGALSKLGGLTSFSNYGSKTVDLAAPGESIYSTYKGGGYAIMHGTSMATPHVAGAIALYSAYHASASASAIRAALLSATTATSALSGKVATGGRLDIGKLLGGAVTPDPTPTPTPTPTGGYTITGTSAADTVSTTVTVSGQHVATAYGDTISGLDGNDVLNGGGGYDSLSGGTGNDNLIGSTGNDTLDGGDGIDRLDGGTGADVMRGGAGSDTYYVDSVSDQVSETVTGTTGGTDLVNSAVTYTLGANLEKLTLVGSATINGTGNELANVIIGNGAANKLMGLAGADTLSGSGGNDTLVGGLGVDRLTGGTGNDRFVFAKGEAAGDSIVDFTLGDIIQLTGYSAGSTLTKVAGSTTDWIITDGATHATETLHLLNGYTLKSTDFLFG